MHVSTDSGRVQCSFVHEPRTPTRRSARAGWIALAIGLSAGSCSSPDELRTVQSSTATELAAEIDTEARPVARRPVEPTDRLGEEGLPSGAIAPAPSTRPSDTSAQRVPETAPPGTTSADTATRSGVATTSTTSTTEAARADSGSTVGTSSTTAAQSATATVATPSTTMFSTPAPSATGTASTATPSTATPSTAARSTTTTSTRSVSTPADGPAPTTAPGAPSTATGGAAVATNQPEPLPTAPTVSSSTVLTQGEVVEVCGVRRSVEALAAETLVAMFTLPRQQAAISAARDGLVGSFVLLGTPTDRAALRGALEAIEQVAPGPDPLFMVDEEGGRVQRLRNVLGSLPSAADQGQLSSTELRELWSEHGTQMATLGFDVNLAPVADIGGGVGITDRSFGDDPATVTERAGDVVAGLSSVGIVPTIKHFPGHGGSAVDSHVALPTTAPLAELMAGIEPYRTLSSDDVAIMVGHLSVPDLTDPGMPTSLTAATYALLRDDLGFDGLVMTDALNMGAVSQASTVPAVAAVVAGTDLAMIDVSQAEVAHRSLLDAVDTGELSIDRLTEAAERVLRRKGSC